ncbi:MAG: LPS assembly lipoprotein LptE [bacterium]
MKQLVMGQLLVVVAGFSLRKITQPKDCDYQSPPITDPLRKLEVGNRQSAKESWQSAVSRRQEIGENWKRLLICSLLVMFLSSCKHLPQKDMAVVPIKSDAVSVLLPASTCSVPMFTNESHQYGLEEVFTNLLIKEIVCDGRIDVVNTQPSDLRINGKILSYQKTPVSYGEDYVDRYRLSTEIEIIILNRSNEVMEKKVFTDFIDFVPVASSLVAKGVMAKEEDEAAQELCQRICCQIVSWIVGKSDSWIV